MSFQDDTVCGKDCGVGFSDETCKCTAADEPACNAPCEATSFCQVDNGWQWIGLEKQCDHGTCDGIFG